MKRKYKEIIILSRDGTLGNRIEMKHAMNIKTLQEEEMIIYGEQIENENNNTLTTYLLFHYRVHLSK